MPVTGAQVAEFLNKEDPATEGHADKVVPVVATMVKSYVRGGIGWTPNAELESVIITAAARLMTTPGQVPVDLGAGDFSQSLRGSFTGWSTAELAVLNRYRRRAQ